MLSMIGHAKSEATVLIVVEEHEFIRGCIASWLKSLDQRFDLAVASCAASVGSKVLAQADAVILCAMTSLSESWLQRQVDLLRSSRPDVPIVLIANDGGERAVQAFASRLGLRAYVGVSSNLMTATAALLLVLGGSDYLPAKHCLDRAAAQLLDLPVRSPFEPVITTRLTPRELAVLDLLRHGMANKNIAHRLHMSQSTVKTHVHNIIAKLQVHNRTEVAVAAHDRGRAEPVPILVKSG